MIAQICRAENFDRSDITLRKASLSMFPLLTAAEAVIKLFFFGQTTIIYDQTTFSVIVINERQIVLFCSILRVTRHLLEQTFVPPCVYYCYQFCSLLFLKSHHLPFRKRFLPCFCKNSQRVRFSYTLVIN